MMINETRYYVLYYLFENGFILDFKESFSSKLANEYSIALKDKIYNSLRVKLNVLAQMSISLDKLVSKTPKSSV